MTDFYDALETRDPAERERDLFAALPRQVLQAQTATAAFATILDGVAPAEVTGAARWQRCRSRASPSCWRCSRNAAQAAFGGFAAIARGARMPRVFASPGPIYEPEGTGRDYWRTARALFAAGFRAGGSSTTASATT